ncbi:hypothetical protein [Streptomyces fuscichromogenes]|uniref:Uncharacterized protein n=1 Tax=Streptomyces fuscichromogenes TaxID=1324013 RepID=A0A917XPJ3_9ACTN|nr:hypothetical protein [Streptomyces fuscichromogenes]GGN47071.1 hypothetical protein GCM10011578_100400 [Streptomyces fuscichromogenes]
MTEWMWPSEAEQILGRPWRATETDLVARLGALRDLHVGGLRWKEGDHVRLRVGHAGTLIDEGLEDEGEDCHIPYRVPRGTCGHIFRVRRYVSPFPYAVLFHDQAETELSLAQGDLAYIGGDPFHPRPQRATAQEDLERAGRLGSPWIPQPRRRVF